MFWGVSSEFVCMAVSGLGLIALGVAQAFIPLRGRTIRMGSAIIGIALAAIVPAGALATESGGLGTAVAAQPVAAVMLALASAFLAANTVIDLGRWRRVAAVGVVLCGTGLVRDAVSRFERTENELTVANTVTLSPSEAYRPPLAPPPVHVVTDSGKPVDVMAATTVRPAEECEQAEQLMFTEWHVNGLVRCRPATDESNCHGWVFTGGKFWLRSAEVAVILSENGYTRVDLPEKGDLAVYHSSSGDILHTAVVWSVENGEVLVEGKWGVMGVYRHPALESGYGSDVTYHRSPRPGHLLIGLTNGD